MNRQTDYTFILFGALAVFLILMASVLLPFGLNRLNSSDDALDSTAAGLGDINDDKVVDVFDVGMFAARYDQAASLSAVHQLCDLNNDGTINYLDLGMLASLIGTRYTTATPTPTPGGPTATPTMTPTPGAPTATPTITPTPDPNASTNGVWISVAELQTLPRSGSAWDAVASHAQGSWGSPDLSAQSGSQMHHARSTVAGAYYAAVTGDTAIRDKTKNSIMSAMETENGGRTLALGRHLLSYINAADVIDMKTNYPSDDASFRSWLQGVRFETLDGRTLESCHADRPNNWGTMCGASLIAADIYLGDTSNLAKHANVFHGFVGNRSVYAGFEFGSSAGSWACSSELRGLNPIDCIKDGHNLSGAMIDDVRRGGSYTWPPNSTHYAWGGVSGAIAQAEILTRAGYPAYEWEQQAIRRAQEFLQNAMPSSASPPVYWMTWVVNHHYGTNFNTQSSLGGGRLMDWTNWTHQ